MRPPAKNEPVGTEPAGLMIGAEPREFAGILKRAQDIQTLQWSDAAWARKARIGRGNRTWILLANGAGPRLVQRMLTSETAEYWRGSGRISQLLSVGLCGALDPALQVGDIVVNGTAFARTTGAFLEGEIYSVDRVIVEASEKASLYRETGCSAVEMESAAVKQAAEDWGVAYGAVRVVSDRATEALPLNFNDYRDTDGNFQVPRIVWAALSNPFRGLPGLIRLGRNSNLANERLGEFLANCEF